MVICGVVIFTATVSAGLIFWRFDAQLVHAKLDDLASETEIQATRFVNQIDELMRDVQVLAGTAPVRGIIRALDNQGVDSVDGSTQAQWERRLAINFEQLLTHKPDYLQLRIIGRANNGRELLRVDRYGPNNSIRRVKPALLQAKANTNYFKRTLNRDPGSVYLSPINLNREQGQIQQPPTPVLRAAIALQSEAGEPLGVLVINFGMARVFDQISQVANPSHRYYLTNGAGDYLFHPKPGYAFAFEFGEPQLATQEFPLLQTLLSGAATQASAVSDAREEVVSMRRIAYGPADLNRSLSVVVTDSFEDVTALTRAVIQQSGMVLLLLLIIGLVAGLWLARLVTKPIMQVAESVRGIGFGKQHWQRPPHLSIEAQELAGALDSAFTALRKRTDELDTSNRELKQFAYIASHDLQEPVRSVSSFATLLSEQYKDVLDERAQHYLRFLVESSERMRALIHGLLEYSRLGSDASVQRVDLNTILLDIQADMQATISEQGATLKVGELPTLNIYAVEVRLLFQNLLSNAIKYVPEGRRPKIQVAGEQTAEGWVFSVCDNGLGIAPNQREKVFMIFQRLHGRDQYEGVGIGLAHVRKIVEMHHGRIWIEANPGGGSCFRFLLNEVVSHD